MRSTPGRSPQSLRGIVGVGNSIIGGSNLVFPDFPGTFVPQPLQLLPQLGIGYIFELTAQPISFSYKFLCVFCERRDVGKMERLVPILPARARVGIQLLKEKYYELNILLSFNLLLRSSSSSTSTPSKLIFNWPSSLPCVAPLAAAHRAFEELLALAILSLVARTLSFRTSLLHLFLSLFSSCHSLGLGEFFS